MNRSSILALVIAIGLLLAPFVVAGTGSWSGTDDAAVDMVSEQDPDYEPWFEPVYEPPSGELETLFFSTQAAIGGGIIGYVLGANRAA